MTNDELKQKVDELLPENVICYGVNYVNHKPHHFMITDKHIKNSPGGILDPDSAPCGFKDCNLKYSEHTSDRVIFLQLKENVQTDYMQKVLQKIVENIPEKSFDGFTFVDTPEKYRII